MLPVPFWTAAIQSEPHGLKPRAMGIPLRGVNGRSADEDLSSEVGRERQKQT